MLAGKVAVRTRAAEVIIRAIDETIRAGQGF